MLSEYTVPWVAAGNPHGHDLALKWIDSKDETAAAVGWATLCSLVATRDDEDVDPPGLRKLLQRWARRSTISPTAVRSCDE